MTKTNYPLLKFSGSLVLLLTITGILLAVGGQLEFLGNERKQAAATPQKKTNDNNAQKPKYSFYDELKKRKTELETQTNRVAKTVDAADTKTEAPSDTYNYVVQVGAFAKKTDANKVKTRVENLGLPARIVSNGRVFLTQAGPFNGKNNAQTAEKRLRGQELDTLIKRL